MITSARPIAIKRSRVHARISLRKEWEELRRSAPVYAAGTEVSGTGVVVSCLSSVLSILRCLTFITRPSRLAPDSLSLARDWPHHGLPISFLTECVVQRSQRGNYRCFRA